VTEQREPDPPDVPGTAVPPPRRTDAPHLGQSPAGIVFRALQGALIGGMLALGVSFVALTVTHSFTAAVLASVATGAAFGGYERRKGDVAFGAGILGFSAALALAAAGVAIWMARRS
jgi:hypothetical protein